MTIKSLEGLKVSITTVSDGHHADVVWLTEGNAQLARRIRELVDVALGEHGQVLNLRAHESWKVVGKDNKFALAVTDSLDGLVDAKAVLARLDN